VPDYCVDEVADHTLALVLAVERRLMPTAGGSKRGECEPSRV
jgi:lactate dehydrogenase-like 2-hydroxyacid dehydrogenase